MPSAAGGSSLAATEAPHSCSAVGTMDGISAAQPCRRKMTSVSQPAHRPIVRRTRAFSIRPSVRCTMDEARSSACCSAWQRSSWSRPAGHCSVPSGGDSRRWCGDGQAIAAGEMSCSFIFEILIFSHYKFNG
eukprot:393592-Prymnesium_polylepis.1